MSVDCQQTQTSAILKRIDVKNVFTYIFLDLKTQQFLYM